jgi:hypothetical protein
MRAPRRAISAHRIGQVSTRAVIVMQRRFAPRRRYRQATARRSVRWRYRQATARRSGAPAGHTVPPAKPH